MTYEPIQRPEPGTEYSVIRLDGVGLHSGPATLITVDENGVHTPTPVYLRLPDTDTDTETEENT